MQRLPPTHLFTGTWEIFYTDVVKTYNKMKSAGVKARLHVAEKMGTFIRYGHALKVVLPAKRLQR